MKKVLLLISIVGIATPTATYTMQKTKMALVVWRDPQVFYTAVQNWHQQKKEVPTHNLITFDKRNPSWVNPREREKVKEKRDLLGRCSQEIETHEQRKRLSNRLSASYHAATKEEDRLKYHTDSSSTSTYKSENRSFLFYICCCWCIKKENE